MTTPEILLLIFAIVLLIYSFVLVDKDKKSKVKPGSNEDKQSKLELSNDEITQLKERINKIISEEVSNAVIDADDKMSKISNEKIMAVNEFSNQLLEKIEQNNSEVVFLFNTLTQKEEDIKVVFSKMETIRRENKEFLEKLTNLMANKNKAKEQSVHKEVSSNVTTPKMNSDPQEDKAETMKKNNEDEAILFIDENPESTESVSSRKEEILRLYKEKNTILEISKQLSVGQGEVKLVIDLFAKK